MTSRLNRDILIARGSSKKAIEQPDLLSSRDPWFRPVDLQLGPDGSLYIADFYVGYRTLRGASGSSRTGSSSRENLEASYRGAPGHLSQGHGLMNLTCQYGRVVEQLGTQTSLDACLRRNFWLMKRVWLQEFRWWRNGTTTSSQLATASSRAMGHASHVGPCSHPRGCLERCFDGSQGARPVGSGRTAPS